jgi:glycosyltransferase involved in cell wall biosynthesis
MPTHIYTSIAANYIPKARVLAHSVKKFHPDFSFHLVLCDTMPGEFRLEQEPFDSVLTLEDLGLDNPAQWTFEHTLVELSTGVKGFALEKLLAIAGCTEVLYLDPDIVVLSPLDRLLAHFQSASILLTPHITEPEKGLEAILDNEFSVLQHGVYNLGFVGVKNSEEGRRFASWWANRLFHFCYDDIPRGIFTDQRWADLIPAYFVDYKILRDPVYNVCTWNLTHRKVTGSLGKGLLVNGEPIVFYHFSGLDSGAQQLMLDKYGAAMPALYALRQWYLAECDRMGQREFSGLAWAFGAFDNGEPIAPEQRKLYRSRGDLKRAFPQPFRTADINQSYYHWFMADQQSQIPKPAAAEAPALPEYRIYLSITDADQSLAHTTARALLRNTYRRAALHLIGAETVLRCVMQDESIREGFRVEALPYPASHADTFAALVERAEGEFAFVKPGIEPARDWDLRLAWTAQRQQGVATVSPVCGRHPLTSLNLLRELPDLGLAEPPASNALDALCYQYSNFETVELSDFVADCVYVSGEAARAARLLGSEARLPGESAFRSFLRLTEALRYSHVLADHVYVGGAENETARAELPPALAALRQNIVNHLRRACPPAPAVRETTLPRQLHIMHSWGGGLERWVREYCRADEGHVNFVLKSIGTWGSFGMDLWLYRHIDDAAPVRAWHLDPAIKSTAEAHAGYAAALAEIVEQFGIERLIISSLIGHSLDALRYPAPKVMVCHDYYPFCPALNITFGEVCRECEEPRLVACTKENPHHRFFRNVPPAAWLALRPAFARAVNEQRVPLIAPSPSVRDHYVQLLPALDGRFQTVSHGVKPLACPPLELEPLAPGEPLRVLVLGSIAPNKGGALLETVWKETRSFCHLFLVGCGEYGRAFEHERGVTILPRYDLTELPKILTGIRPHVGLLPSVVPETFSYTLQELCELAIPVLATRIGSFADRIEDGVNGFLCDPNPAAVAAALRRLHSDFAALERVHRQLLGWEVRDLRAMLRDYDGLLARPDRSAKAYFCADSRRKAAQESVRAQLFCRPQGQGYDEATSVAVPFLPQAQRQTLRFPIPELPWGPARFRLDLADRPGLVLLHALRILDTERRAIWEWDQDWSSLESGAHQTVPVKSSALQSGVLLYLAGHDAHIELPPAAAAPEMQGGGALEVDFSWAPALDGSETRASASVTAATAAGAFEVRQLTHELADARSRIYDLEHSLSWRVTDPLRKAADVVVRLRSAWVNRHQRPIKG